MKKILKCQKRFIYFGLTGLMKKKMLSSFRFIVAINIVGFIILGRFDQGVLLGSIFSDIINLFLFYDPDDYSQEE